MQRLLPRQNSYQLCALVEIEVKAEEEALTHLEPSFDRLCRHQYGERSWHL